MDFNDKIVKMEQELHEKGIKKSTFAPIGYRMMWSLGIKITPPLFTSFISNFLFTGIQFGFFWGILMYFFQWRNLERSFLSMFVTSLAAGILFGLFISFYYRYLRKKYNLPEWDDYN